MNKNIIKIIKEEQRYKLLIRNLRMKKEGENNEKANNKKN